MKTYIGKNANRVAFPLGGMGAGMICVEGAGSFTSVSLRHRPEIYHEPALFAALSWKGKDGPGGARVLAGPMPEWKLVFPWGNEFHSSGDGDRGKLYGLPRFAEAAFSARFPFARVELSDPGVPVRASLDAWSPFIPNDADNSSLPVAGLEYRLANPTAEPVEAVFSFHAENFMKAGGKGGDKVSRAGTGFVLEQAGDHRAAWQRGQFAAWIDDPGAKVNAAWFRGGWFDPLTLVWKGIEEGALAEAGTLTEGAPSPGGSIALPLVLAPGEERTVTVKWAWYAPVSNLDSMNMAGEKYRPWYAARFAGIGEVRDYWTSEYEALRARSGRFSGALHASTLPPEALDAVAANLAILKSPTVLRQHDGRLWAWEGCHDDEGSCSGTCTHVWNYAQALPHLFPGLERGLRETEFLASQDAAGHQNFRATLPIGPHERHDFHAAADGQLGGIVKLYRDWRIAGDTEWVRRLWPAAKRSLDYCIAEWDPEHRGLPEEPHHNTYDVEFWGPNGMCGSIYLGALAAALEIGRAVGDEIPLYAELLAAGRKRLEGELFNGDYFEQRIQWTGLHAADPTRVKSFGGDYSPEGLALLDREGPKYQYGAGCLSDGVLGAWFGWAAGLPAFLDEDKVGRHLDAVARHNFKSDLSLHANPQRSGYAQGAEGGLLLCTWPRGGRLTLPLPYSEEVWTGIEYQVAAHLIALGRLGEGMKIVRAARARYDGRRRNPFNEYECGHWYGRALASYALLQAFGGLRYDAVEKVLHVRPALPGNYACFLSTATGFGIAGVREGAPFVEVHEGEIDIVRLDYRPGISSGGEGEAPRNSVLPGGYPPFRPLR